MISEEEETLDARVVSRLAIVTIVLIRKLFLSIKKAMLLTSIIGITTAHMARILLPLQVGRRKAEVFFIIFECRKNVALWVVDERKIRFF